MELTSKQDGRAREIVSRLRAVRQEEQDLQDELFDIMEANGWYSGVQMDEINAPQP